MRKLFALTLPAILAACVSPSNYVEPQARPTLGKPATPPMRPIETPPTPKLGFQSPEIMRLPGLESVVGARENALTRRFGPPRLRVAEGDAVKLQFSGEPCVLDVYLYPTTPGATPSATHVEARRASDGRHVDRASCVAALKRN